MATRFGSRKRTLHRHSKPAEPIRRAPRQERARQTVEAIFEATARILEKEGLEGANTNRIAEWAGISIGTLYQYFPDKDAIFVAMARRELERDRAALHRAIADLADESAAGLARATIRALIARQRDRHQVRRLVMRVHLALGLGAEHFDTIQDIAQRIGARRSWALAQGDTPLGGPHPGRPNAGTSGETFGAGRLPPVGGSGDMRLFIVTRAIRGAVDAAMLEQPDLLDSPEFEDELVRLAGLYAESPVKALGEEPR